MPRKTPPTPARTARLRTATVLPALVLVAATACTPTIAMDAAPDATNPACASVMLALPESLGTDLPQVKTNAQATTAWGEGGAAVTLRCGVEPPGPSADCQRVDSGQVSVDWIVETEDGTWRFTTYGRDPAVEVIVPPTVTAQHSTSFVADLSQAVAQIEATRTCS